MSYRLLILICIALLVLDAWLENRREKRVVRDYLAGTERKKHRYESYCFPLEAPPGPDREGAAEEQDLSVLREVVRSRRLFKAGVRILLGAVCFALVRLLGGAAPGTAGALGAGEAVLTEAYLFFLLGGVGRIGSAFQQGVRKAEVILYRDAIQDRMLRKYREWD